MAGPDGALGRRLREERERRGLTLRALARQIGVSPATLSHIETGKTRANDTRLQDIACALGVAPAGLTAGHSPADAAEPAEPPADWRAYPPPDLDPVLRAALDLFLAVGYHGASVRDIAARSGLSVSGIYHYHPSKQQMLVRILDLTMADLLARAELARAEGADPVARFRLLVENLALFHTHRRELGFIGASEMRSLERANHERIVVLRVRQQRMLDDEVEAAAALGLFDVHRPRQASRAVVTMCTSLVQWYDPAGPMTPEEIALEYVEFALDLVRFRRPPRHP